MTTTASQLYNKEYEYYQKQPSANKLWAVVQSYHPLIYSTVTRYIGNSPSKTILDRAYILTAKAIQSYNPQQNVPLQTWISKNLMKIKEVQKQASEIITVPEALRREYAALQQAKEELQQKLFREPTPEELADHTGISVKKQKRLQRGIYTVPESTFSAVDDEDENTNSDLFAVSKYDPTKDAMTYVYHDSDDIDRLIIRHRFGYDNSPILQGQEIAKKANISSAAVTKRLQKIQQKISEVSSWLQ